MFFGEVDPRVRVETHPNPSLGTTLVAAQSLKRGDTFSYWGRRVSSKRDMTHLREDYLLTCRRKIIDPTPFRDSSLLQYANCPGKGEMSNIFVTNSIQKKGDLFGCILRMTKDVEEGGQLCYYYGRGWFEDRGLERVSLRKEGT